MEKHKMESFATIACDKNSLTIVAFVLHLRCFWGPGNTSAVYKRFLRVNQGRDTMQPIA